MPLNNIEFEYEVFRYIAILAANQVSNDARNTLIELLPTLEQLDNSVRVRNKFITDNQKIVKELKPLIEAKIALEDKGIFEWDVIIEKYCGWSWVGICAPENLDYNKFAGYQSTGY
ncbi:hypothetical protein GLOIN_2v1802430 [Rhizophagus clarus]|uniref:Uncharacterized protein n=1 Tax=Rhizophagus clarus TaxID=94130 RepID=A0A8H3M6N7_9GLOM|nr:hypothetical protein GLOIN_2v1802430 [Rhizophagus clarus]